MIQVTGNAVIDLERNRPEELILATWHESREHEVASVQENDAVVFPYLPKQGALESSLELDGSEKPLEHLIARNTTLDDLGIRMVEFKNGVRLNIKKTDFKKNKLIFRVDFGRGKQSEPEGKPGLALVSRAVLNESGVGQLTMDELETALAGRNVNVHFNVDEDAFQFSGSASSDEIELLFQLIYTRMVDPAFRHESLVLFKERYAQMFQELTRTTNGMMSYEGERFLAGGDSRFGMPTMAQVNAIGLDDIQAWLKPELKGGDIEISVVGDLDVDQVISVASTYFKNYYSRVSESSVRLPESPSGMSESSVRLSESSARLPESLSGVSESSARLSESSNNTEIRIPIFPKGQTVNLVLESRIEKALVVMAFPTDDFWNIGQTRRLNILAKIFSERLRKILREEMGATYSPYAYNQSSQVYDGYGVLRGVVAIAPDRVDDVVGHMDRIAYDLAHSGVTQKDLDLVLGPILTYIRDMIKTNGYWLNSVLAGSGAHPEKLAWAGTIIDEYRSISVAEISQIASKFVKLENMAKIVIQPSPESY